MQTSAKSPKISFGITCISYTAASVTIVYMNKVSQREDPYFDLTA